MSNSEAIRFAGASITPKTFEACQKASVLNCIPMTVEMCSAAEAFFGYLGQLLNTKLTYVYKTGAQDRDLRESQARSSAKPTPQRRLYQ